MAEGKIHPELPKEGESSLVPGGVSQPPIKQDPDDAEREFQAHGEEPPKTHEQIEQESAVTGDLVHQVAHEKEAERQEKVKKGEHAEPASGDEVMEEAQSRVEDSAEDEKSREAHRLHKREKEEKKAEEKRKADEEAAKANTDALLEEDKKRVEEQQKAAEERDAEFEDKDSDEDDDDEPVNPDDTDNFQAQRS